MRIREDSVEDEEDARVGMLRAAVKKSVDPSQYMKYLLLDVIETYFPLLEDDQERFELLSREENRAVRDFERTWAERLMLTGFFEGSDRPSNDSSPSSLGLFRLGSRAASTRSRPRTSWTATSRA